MAVNSVTTATNSQVNAAAMTQTYEVRTVSAEFTAATVSATVSTGEAAVYEKSSDKDQSAAVKEHKIDYETIDRLKAEADERNASLRGLVEKMLLKQGGTLENSKGLANMYRKLEVDPEIAEQAKKDIAEDGYWGIEQTSDRIVDFAKALAGDNPEFAADMLEAIKEGFKQAGIEWGEDLPDISQKTMEATYKKMNDWIGSLGGSSESAGAAASAAVTQVSATVSTVKVSASYTRIEAGETRIEAGGTQTETD